MRRMYFIDLFCGAGGVTSGIIRALYKGQRFAKVIACVNHDPLAIASHKENHPDVLHYIEDIRTLDLTELCELVESLRRKDPDCLIFIWASLECTNFSKAKGGLPRDADSRTLADHMPRYLEELQPDGLWIENVEEFMSWGPLDENGKPVSKRSGEDYIRWVNHIQSFGYCFDFRLLNAADYGAYTSRRRYFAQFMRPGLPIVWPEATHAKNPSGGSLFGGLEKWRAVKDVLDFSDEGQSIFGRKKPLSEKTLERIFAGLIKYVAGGKDAFIAKYYSGNPQSMVIPVDGPAATVRTTDAQALIKAAFITKYFSGKPEGKVIPVDGPAGTVTTFGGQAVVQAAFLSQRNTGNPTSKVFSVDGPARTLTTTAGNMELVQTAFLAKYYSNGGQLNSVDEPAATLPTKDRISKVQAVWLDKNYSSGNHNHQPVTQPAGTILTNDKHALITAEGSFLMGTNYDNKPTSLHAPSPTVTASRKWSYLVNPSWGGCPTGTDQPSPVIIARGDKARMYLVQTETGELGIQIFETDSPTMIKIKMFMAAYGIIDIKMRMLKIPELLRIQGFGDGYILKGTQSDRKRFIGNAVEVNQARVLIEASYRGLIESQVKKIA